MAKRSRTLKPQSLQSQIQRLINRVLNILKQFKNIVIKLDPTKPKIADLALDDLMYNFIAIKWLFCNQYLRSK